MNTFDMSAAIGGPDPQCACFADHSDECVCSGAPPRCEECLDVLSQDRLDGRHLLCYECDPDENSEDAAEADLDKEASRRGSAVCAGKGNGAVSTTKGRKPPPRLREGPFLAGPQGLTGRMGIWTEGDEYRGLFFAPAELSTLRRLLEKLEGREKPKGKRGKP